MIFAEKALSLKFQIPFLLMITLTLILGCSNGQEDESKKKTKIVYGSVPVIIEAPVHIAYQKKFFDEQDLDVDLRINPDGATSLTQLFDGTADIIGVTGTPIVYNSFIRDDFYIIGDVKHYNIHFCLGRKDKGVENISDLKGKRIAVMLGTSGEFFMDLFFAYHGIDRSEVDLVNLNAPDMLKALVSGDVDAMFCWEPWIMKAHNALGENSVLLPNENIHVGSWVIVVLKKYADKHPDILKRFIQAIVKAEEYIQKNPDDAIKIHSEVSSVDPEIAKSMMDKLTHGMVLDESLLATLEDQARWAVKSKYVDSSKIPNYLNLIYFDALYAVRPDSVTIIR